MKVSFITITVKELEYSSNFYKEIIGLDEVTRFSELIGDKTVNIAFLKDPRDNDSGLIELIEYENWAEKHENYQRPTMSIAFEVDDLDEMMGVIGENSIEIIRGPFETPSGDMKFVFIKDPNGAVIELIQGFDINNF